MLLNVFNNESLSDSLAKSSIGTKIGLNGLIFRTPLVKSDTSCGVKNHLSFLLSLGIRSKRWREADDFLA